MSPSAPRPSATSRTGPADLEAWEGDVASWMGLLDSVAPPPSLRRRVLDAPPAARPWGWGVRIAAVAALLVLALGVAAFSRAAGEVSLAADILTSGNQTVGTVPAFVVHDDPCVPLYYALETFGSLEDPDHWGLARIDGQD